MACLDIEGMYYKCDRCFSEYEFEQGVSSKSCGWPLMDHLYARRIRPNLGDFCNKCADEVAPLLYKLRDIDELRTCVNKLKGVINEKRNPRN